MTTPRPPDPRIRFGLGLLLGLAVALGGGWTVVRGARNQLEDDWTTRRATVAANALTSLVVQAGDDAAVRKLVTAWQETHPPGTRVRVIRGTTLEASTDPADTGARAAPRRLAREEKPLFDQAQRLRAGADSNREGGAPKPELEVEPEGGARQVAVPLEADGKVIGMVQVLVPAEPPAAGRSPLQAMLLFLAALVLYVVAAWLLPPKTVLLAAVSTVLFCLATAFFIGGELRDLGLAERDGQRALARTVSVEVERVRALTGATTVDGGAWDTDLSRKPHGLVTGAGVVDREAGEAEAQRVRRGALRSLLAVAALGLVVLVLVGFGGASRAGRALVTNRQAYAYTAPAMIATGLLVFFPFLYGFALSFTSSNIYNTNLPLSELWVGLRNYGAILGDFGFMRRAADGHWVFNYLNFYWTFLFTVIWTITNVTWGVSFGLLLALILNIKGLAFRPIYRVILILPWAMPNYITSLIWKGMFHRQFGVVNQVLQIFGFEPLSWFDHPFTSYLTALATNGWLSFPFMMVVSLGALQSIPADLYEAARVDGANRWQQFRAITLPSLRPALVPAIILSVVWTFNMFNVIYLVTAGEPGGSTEILITQAYKYAFQRYQYGYAAAYSTIIFLILLVYGTFQNRVTRATEAL
ncbi:MAG TPA: sugar ABC transporter permease [Myxococcaceae bacterium]|nr:sugar ABC transporter permease [Myxococcaceae bacterium]